MVLEKHVYLWMIYVDQVIVTYLVNNRKLFSISLIEIIDVVC